MALGKEVGRVSIRVTPDSTKFRADLRKVLERAERAASVNVSVTPNLDQSALRRVQDKLNDLKATAAINVDVDSKIAQARLATVARDRIATVHVRTSGTQRAAAALAALSGARVLGDVLSGVRAAISRLDRSAPRIASIATLITGLGGAALAASSNLLALGASLAAVAGAGLALPGIFAGFAVGLGVMVAALKDATTVLADLGPAFTRLQNSISAAFWERAAQPIRDLVNGLLPQLQDSLTGVASNLGGMFAAVSNALSSNLGGGVLGAMMANLSESIQIATRAVEPLVSAFTTLGTVGSQYLPRLAEWFVTISERFQGFISSANASGALQGWIDGGIQALSELGRVVANLGGIFGNLAAAAQAAGGATLGTLADALERINAVTAGPAFQGALTTIFEGAHRAMAGLAQAGQPLANMFVILAGTIGGVLGTAGQILGTALGGIADALNQIAVQQGITALFDGILAAVQQLAPALMPVGALLGTLAGVVGTLASTLGGVLAAAVSALAPALTTVASAIQPVISVLGGALTSVIQALAPAFTIVADALVQLLPLLSPIVALLGQTLASAIAAVIPVFQVLIQGLTQLVAAVLPMIVPLLQPLVAALLQVQAAIAPLVAQVISQLVPVLLQLVQAVFPPLIQVIQAVIPTVVMLVQALAPLVSTILSAVIPAIQALLPIVSTVFNAVASIITSVMQIVRGIIATVTGLISGDWSQAWNGIKQIASGVWNTIKSVIQGAINIVRSVISGALNAIKSIWSSIWNSVRSIVSSAWDRIKVSILTAIATVVSTVSGLPGKILNGLGNLGSLLYSAGSDLIQGLIDGVVGMVGSLIDSVAGAVGSAIDAAKDLLGINSPSRVFMEIGRQTGEGFVLGVDSKAVDAQRSMRNMVRTPNVNTFNDVMPAVGAGGGALFEWNGDAYGPQGEDIVRAFQNELTVMMAGRLP